MARTACSGFREPPIGDADRTPSEALSMPMEFLVGTGPLRRATAWGAPRHPTGPAPHRQRHRPRLDARRKRERLRHDAGDAKGVLVPEHLHHPSDNPWVRPEPPSPEPSADQVADEHVAKRVRRNRGTVHAEGMEDRGSCLLYTSDAADDLLCVDLGGRR